jgi:hypothetical protein
LKWAYFVFVGESYYLTFENYFLLPPKFFMALPQQAVAEDRKGQ